MKRIILSGGGTGGHIYPALTIAKEISNIEEVKFLYVGTPHGMESRIVPKEGYPFEPLPAMGLKREITLKNLLVLLKTARSFGKASSIIRHFKPDVVIGTGGYVSGTILLAAALHHVPTLIQEQNVIPGITNKILSHFVDTICLGYSEAQHRFPCPQKCVFTGNPIRSDILSSSRGEARKALGLTDDQFMVLITGGSRGARSINQSMIPVHEYFKDDPSICLYHVTGSLGYKNVIDRLGFNDKDVYSSSSRIISYEYHMPDIMAAADLIICRAGAVSLAELAARGLPSILIPYPYAAEDHQTFNAKVFAKAGAAVFIPDKELNGKKLIHEIETLKENTDKLHSMAAAAKGLGHIHAGHDIAAIALQLAERGKK